MMQDEINKTEEKLLESGWSEKVSNDPKHRPQVLDRPSTTVRKEWCRRPQEAHLANGTKYRRLSVAEISRIQSFPLDWVNVEGISENERIAVLGNAVPPLLSKCIAEVLKAFVPFENKTLLEICAGIGGLSYGFDYLKPIAKIELWDIAAKVLRKNEPNSCVIEGFAQEYDYDSVKGKVGLLCGGPPCQPWSQAGHQKGAEDPRDVMGFTPTAIAACEPEAFLFENVPGLFTASEHRAYVTDLLKRMGNPKEGLRYGVATIILNAADYGVPQIRRRVIILGIKNKSNTFAHKVLTSLQNKATHHDPSKPAVGKTPWVTLRQAFVDIPETEPWIRWKVTEETLRRLQLIDESEFVDEDVSEDMPSAEDLFGNYSQGDNDPLLSGSTAESVNQNTEHNNRSIPPRIELLWPGKNDDISFTGSAWKFSQKTEQSQQRALVFDETIGAGDNCLGHVVRGDYLSSLKALMSFVPGCVQVVYFDSPRMSVLEAESAPGYSVSTWLSIVQNAALLSYKSLKPVGFFILHTDEEMAHYGRQVLDEVFGKNRHVTTFAWQKKYAPQNDKNKNNPTDAFDYIIVYSKCSLEDLPKIGILQRPDDIIDDGDWRGCYTAGHKGAKSGSESTKFHVNAPPYRWKLLESNLPSGRYWFDEITGVLWFESVETTGEYWVKVECFDSENSNTVKTITFNVREPKGHTDHFELPTRIWWLLKDDNDIKADGELSINDAEIPDAIKGDQYSIVFKATGGKPFTMKSSAPGSNRYWEFALNTLVEAIATTNASFGAKGSALPSRKTFHDRENTQVRMAVMNWLPWQEFGKSEDASRHVKALVSSGITSGILNLTAKPQKLLYHLIMLFAPNEKDLVVSLGDINGVFASVAIKTHRSFIHITGSSSQDVEAWNNTARKRLLAVISNQDSGEVEKDDPMPCEYTIQQGYIDVLSLSKQAIVKDNNTGAVRIAGLSGEGIADFYAGLAGAYKKQRTNEYTGMNGNIVIVLDSDEILDTGLLSYLSYKYSKEKIIIIAERLELGENNVVPENVSVLHAPFDLLGR